MNKNVKIAKELIKIANKLFLSNVFKNYNNHLFVDSDYKMSSPTLLSIKKLNDKWQITFFKKSFFSKKQKYHKKDYFSEEIKDIFARNDSINGIESELKKYLGISYNDIVKGIKIYNDSELVKLLLNEYSFELRQLQDEKIFNISDDCYFKMNYKNFEIIYHKKQQQQQIKHIIDEVINKCGNLSSKLCNGRIEISSAIKKSNETAHYDANSNCILISDKIIDNDDIIIHAFLHELGHKYWFNNNFSQHSWFGKTQTLMINGSLINQLFIKAKNGEIKFPTRYSGENIHEFFAECFALMLQGKLDINIKSELQKIII